MKPTRHIIVAGMTLTLAFGMTPTAALAAENPDSEIIGEANGADAAGATNETVDVSDVDGSEVDEAAAENEEAYTAEDEYAEPVDESDEGEVVEAPASYDKADFYVEAPTVMMMSRAYAAPMAASVAPVALSDEMKYFTAYESGCNYDQGLSWGDGYHAMGYYQFDNRYGLDDFLISCYNYDPDTYSMFKWVLTADITGDLYNYSTGKLTSIGTKLNSSWHAAYKADPAGFSALQDNWAYKEYYLPAENYLKSLGIDISERADCVKGLVWGMSNLYGTSGWRKFVGGYTSGYDWNGTWHDSYKWPGAWNGDYKKANAMSDREFVTTLCDYVVNNVAVFYKAQPEYHAGWQNRYRSEKADCLAYIAQDEAQQADSLSYNANGGSGKMSATNGTVNKSVKVAACGFTRDGYEFMGWNTKKDGSGKSYAAGSNYTLTEGDDVLYAQWKKKQVVVPTPPAESDDAVSDNEGSTGSNGSGNEGSAGGNESNDSGDSNTDNSGSSDNGSSDNGSSAEGDSSDEGNDNGNGNMSGDSSSDNADSNSGSDSDESNDESTGDANGGNTGEESDSDSNEAPKPAPLPPSNSIVGGTTSNGSNSGSDEGANEAPENGNNANENDGDATDGAGDESKDESSDGADGSNASDSNATSDEKTDSKADSDKSNTSGNDSSEEKDKTNDTSKSDENGNAGGDQGDTKDAKESKAADEDKETLLKTNDESAGVVAALVGGFALAFGVAAGTLRRILGRN
ncbi:InlB B-repeat-containing protein [uncultured Slackia sp.]|uniref:VgrG-related protein n=1 Tax=uncultured Slackia sp. TaxID=665903 RepID=UPI0025D1BB62|nr:InlB B-repeat-containing protein [uncultured Slackia sp.]